MSDIIKICKFDHHDVFKKAFYDMTQRNMCFNGRSLYSVRRGKVENNRYFPLDEAKNALRCSGVYLFAYEDSDEEVDIDFDIGFNNLEHDIEKDWILKIMSEASIYVSIYISDPYYNKETVKLIEKQYDTVVSIENQRSRCYLVKLTSEDQFQVLKSHIHSYFICNNDLHCFLNQNNVFGDLKSISELINHGITVVERVSLFAHYNLMAYSGSAAVCDLLLSHLEEAAAGLDDLKLIHMNGHSPYGDMLTKNS